MRDPKRISEALGLIGDIWLQYPDVRFFQLLNHLVREYMVCAEVEDVDLFNSEDDKFIAFLKSYKTRKGI